MPAPTAQPGSLDVLSGATTAYLAGSTLDMQAARVRQGYRAIAADGAVTLSLADQYVHLLSSTTGTKVVDVTAGAAGQVVVISLLDRSGGSYTVTTADGTSTLDTGGDTLVIAHNGTAWRRVLFADASASTIGSGAVGTTQIADAAVTPVKQSNGARIVAADGALVLAATDRAVALAGSTDANAKAATMTATHDGHLVQVQLAARSSTGTYTLAATSLAGVAGTVTLDAAGEGVDLVRISGTWYVFRLAGGATFA